MGPGTGTQDWRIRCCRCGCTRPLGRGAVRLGAWSWKKFTVGRCPGCRRFGFQAIERRPADDDFLIRDETPADADAIAAVTIAAFASLEVSDQTEHHVVAALREAGALIRRGLERLAEVGARGCCLVGHPEYYPRFGFAHHPQLVHEGVPPEAFMALSFDGHVPRGTVVFHEGFAAN